jgi:hypothetical protein
VAALLGGLLVVQPRHTAASPNLTYAKACRSVMTANGKAYANARRRLLLSCLKKLLTCELKYEVEGTDPKNCRSSAVSSCRTKLDTADVGLDAAQNRFDDKTLLACAPMGIANVCSNAAGGLWFANDPTCGSTNDTACGGSASFGGLLDCLRGEIEDEVDANVARVFPRGGLLLDNADPSLGAKFPDLPRPASTNVTVAATGPGTCVLVNPGVISLPAANRLKVTGDSTTLPYGANPNNGKLTITIGPSTATSCADVQNNAQLQQVISEDYSQPTDVAYFGPLNDDRKYCIDLKDQSCSHEVFGTIDVDVPSAAPSSASATLLTCQKLLLGRVKVLSSFVSNKIHGCADKRTNCKLASEIDSVDATACLANAATPCGVSDDKVEAKIAAFKTTIVTNAECILAANASSNLNDLKQFAGGLGFANSGAGCEAATDLGVLADCLLGVANGSQGASCSAQSKTMIRDPRAFDSLNNPAITGMDPATDFPCLTY